MAIIAPAALSQYNVLLAHGLLVAQHVPRVKQDIIALWAPLPNNVLLAPIPSPAQHPVPPALQVRGPQQALHPVHPVLRACIPVLQLHNVTPVLLDSSAPRLRPRYSARLEHFLHPVPQCVAHVPLEHFLLLVPHSVLHVLQVNILQQLVQHPVPHALLDTILLLAQPRVR
jgi:hypothetical protein